MKHRVLLILLLTALAMTTVPVSATPTAPVLKIAFVSNGDLYFSDGAKVIQVTSGWQIYGAAVSPLGDKVAFVGRNEQDAAGLFFWQKDQLPKLINHANEEIIKNLTWSPDGQKLAFVKCDAPPCMGCDSFNYRIFIAKGLSGWDPRCVYWKQWPGIDDMVWGQEGIAYQITGKVFLLDPNTWDSRFLTEGKNPTWSPDGERLAFTYHCYDGKERLAVKQMDTPAGHVYFSQDDGYNPIWSPNSERLAFERLVIKQKSWLRPKTEYRQELFLAAKDIFGREKCLSCSLAAGDDTAYWFTDEFAVSQAVWINNQDVAVFVRCEAGYFVINVDTMKTQKIALPLPPDPNIPPSVVVR